MAETIIEIPLDELHPFPDHPFGVRDDDMMQQTVESVREYGVIVPGIARPREDGGYEIVSGHRRKHACELASLKTMPFIIRDIDRNTATIIMVDSNLQRENILPSEKAKAYKMKLEAIKRRAGRPGRNSVQVGQNYEGKTSREQIAENSPDSATQIQRYSFIKEQGQLQTEVYSFVAALSASNITKQAIFHAGETATDYSDLHVYLDSPIIFVLLMLALIPTLIWKYMTIYKKSL